jgi:hypothetical protein
LRSQSGHNNALSKLCQSSRHKLRPVLVMAIAFTLPNKYYLFLIVSGLILSLYLSVNQSDAIPMAQQVRPSHLHFSLNHADPSRVDRISFDLDLTSSRQLTHLWIRSSHSVHVCDLIDHRWSCPLPDRPRLLDLDQLEIIFPAGID